MRLKEALPGCKEAIGSNFGTLFKEQRAEIEEMVKRDKGWVGKSLENYLGLPPSSKLLDFEDGELKTTKYKEPSIAITKINSTETRRDDGTWTIDPYISNASFVDSPVHRKTERIILMKYYCEPDKERTWEKWRFEELWNLDASCGAKLFKKLEADYQFITKVMTRWLESSDDNMLRTIPNSKSSDYEEKEYEKHSIIQIRTKGQGNGNDTRMWSERLDRYVTGEREDGTPKAGYTFYFKSANLYRFLDEKCPELLIRSVNHEGY